ncbi:hypothetical protein P3X46_002911 [Hevea brasiliensis]|uniref:Glycosyl hydrolase family 32 N-terminal domain-containing protein n=1 Tax=Hevea brasiliensis TaxID=3981 RepID=A0ABQ9N4I0_HEVBR|nr:uncharacterized protein LOC110673677 [Hevea brasiliensis]KAJ9187456.1 hypothetical protein P3X46_002911 [Hevea brasiliensis]
MDAARRITIAAASVSASSNTRRMAKAINLVLPAWPSSTSISFTRNQKGPFNPRKYSLLLARCSTKPGIDSNNNATSRNPAIELDSNSMARLLSNPPHAPPESKGLVFDLGPRNSWDSTEIGSPVVKRYIGDNEERWYMWYHGRSSESDADDDNNSDQIGLAVSSNGIHWTRGSEPVRSCEDVGVVMNCSKNWWAFDTESIRPSEMMIMSSPMYSSVYWLYYTGFSSAEVEISGFPNVSVENPERVHDEPTKFGKIFKSLPGLACSQDGRHWARIDGDHHSGALLDVGSGEEWDSLFIAAPHVVVHGSDDVRMYYYSFDAQNGHYALGVARSRDGIRWVKLGKILGRGKEGCFDELGVQNACVVRSRKDGKYLMAYEGVAADEKRSIGLAESPDGLKNWKRVQEDPVLEASEGDGWDNEGVRSPCLIQMEDNKDEWRLYYVGVGKGGRTGIGMAISGGTNIRTFRRSSGFPL